MPQTLLGQTVSHALNISRVMDKVEYWGGVTFSTTRNQDIAVPIGNYINVETDIYNDFDEYILSDEGQIARHEYGHINSCM